MRALLLHPDRDFDPSQTRPWNEAALTQDLELEVLLHTMAGESKLLLDAIRTVIFAGFHNDVTTVLYRQAILKDCLKNSTVVRKLYELTGEAIAAEQKHYWLGISRYAGAILSESTGLMKLFVSILRQLREQAVAHGSTFESDGFTRFFGMIKKELSEDYLRTIEGHLEELEFRNGVLVSAQLGPLGEGTNYTLRHIHYEKQTWLERVLGTLGKGAPAYTYRLADRDEAGARILTEMRDRGINRVGNALAQSCDHILGFFSMLRTELAFYVGCLNLHDKLTALGSPTCFPEPAEASERRHGFQGLYDISLSLTMDRPVVANNVDLARSNLVVVTGANQGGKSSFLRSIGLAQLMMQCGLFVGAEHFAAGLCPALFTHYRRREDASMKRGKFDEELARMSEIVDHLVPNSILLFNESFAATNEREGSAIASQIVSALLESRMKVFFVTHLYEFAHGFHLKSAQDTFFLRAERKPDGARTFKMIPGEPLETSFGEDLYREVFAASA